MVFIGAEHITSPLGLSAEENFKALLENRSAILMHENIGYKGESLPVAMMGQYEHFDLTQQMINSIQDSFDQLNIAQIDFDRTLLLISTTKGEIVRLKKNNVAGAELVRFRDDIHGQFPNIKGVQLVSNACISGVLALIVGHDMIVSGEYDHVMVCGGDMLSEFTVAGFQSFFALSDEICKPFDKNRKGINLGEGVASVFLSKNDKVYKSAPLKLLGGTSANDANHISGPSRTGEGLFRSIDRTLRNAGLNSGDIDFLSAHGTGTAYNDEMESIAFDRMGLGAVPMHSLKGYYGHTFGAAGMIETAICMQSMRNDYMIASAGFEEAGTSKDLNVLKSNEAKELKLVLKTASGFGGCNASLVLAK